MSGRRILAPILLGACAAAGLAQPARFANARFETRSAGNGLERTWRDLSASTAGPAWVGWSVESVGSHHMCCYGSIGELDASPCSGRCYLENEGRNVTFVDSNGGDCLERTGSSVMLVLLRIEEHLPDRLRTFSTDCTIDAGGLPVYWLTDVRPSDSVGLLRTLVGNASLAQKKRWKTGEPALAAIAMHDDPSADEALEGFAAPSNPDPRRKKAIFWLGNARGRRGYEFLRALSEKDDSDEVRRDVTFALSQSRVPEATETLIAMARKDRSPRVRGQALFWLAQKAGRKAASAIQDAIRDDPETDVKRKAVFALTQMPREEGIPLLIEVARTNRNPAVRKQAIFWLGQSKDPRALDFIEEVLK